MSTASAPPTWLVDSTRVGPNASDEPALAGERGVTVIRPRVVERVAAQLSARCLTPLAPAGGCSATPSAQATVRAQVDGAVATVDVAMAVIYPAPVLAVTRRTRHHITDRIVELTGLSVRRVDITVVERGPTDQPPGQVRAVSAVRARLRQSSRWPCWD